nr:SEC-C domain-containing protein [Armatimonas sp.]
MRNMEESLGVLRDFGDKEEWDEMPTPEFIAELVAHGTAIAPHLAAFLTPEALRERNAHTDALDKIGWVAALVLCDIGDPATAVAAVYAVFQANDEEMPEWAYKHFGQFGEAVIEPLLAVIRDRSLEWYFPAMAINTLEIVVKGNADAIVRLTEVLYNEVEYYLKRYKQYKKLTKKEAELFASMAAHLSNYQIEEARPLLEASLKTGLIDRYIFSQKALEDDYSLPLTFDWIPEKVMFLEHYKNWHATNQLHTKEQEAKRVKEALAEAKKLLRGRPAPPPTKKPGRNDACWCGSGKKYKKCHLDIDQGR